MRGAGLIRGTTRRGVFAFTAAAVAATVLGAASTQAALGRGSSFHRVNRSGTYNGEISQLSPQSYTGHIHFIVRGGKLRELRFTAGTTCGAMWAIDKDHAVPDFPVPLKPTGTFSYSGTVAGRVIRLDGRIIGNTATGTFFQSFSTSGLACTMGQAAAFTATR